jgi:hypothetical protein
VHSTIECIVCQPSANYRPLRIGNIRHKDFINAMTDNNQDIMEEMYVFLYEINQNDDVTLLHTENKVLIYPTYSVNSKTDDLFPILRKVPIFHWIHL